MKMYEPEVGQSVFGNEYGEFDMPKFAIALFNDILEEIDRIYWNKNQEEWERWDDPEISGITYRPYYWGNGEDPCGFEDADKKWAEENRHTDNCFHTRYYQEVGRLQSAGNRPYLENNEPMTTWAKENGYLNAPFGMAVYCDCGHNENYTLWRKTHGHTKECPIAVPNFVLDLRPDIEIRWYKYPGRGMSVNRYLAPDEWVDWYNAAIDFISNKEER